MQITISSPLCPGDYFPALTALCNLAETQPTWQLSFKPRLKEWKTFFDRTCPKLTSQPSLKTIVLKPKYDGLGKDLSTIYTEDLADQLNMDIPVVHKVPVLDLKCIKPFNLQTAKPIALTTSCGKNDFTSKHWVADRKSSPYIQEVIDSTPQFQWVQLGQPTDTTWMPDLKNVIDLRDKTNNPSDLFSIASQAQLILTPISLLAWIGASLNIKTIILAGGREIGATQSTPLPQLPNLYFFGSSLACAGQNGCWKARTIPLECGIDALDALNASLCTDPVECRGVMTPNCMASITPDMVVERIEQGWNNDLIQLVEPIHQKHKVLITGGIGDALTLESHWDNHFRDRIEKFYYATRQSRPIMEIFKVLFPNAKHEVLWDNWSNRFNFLTKEQVGRVVKNKPDDWEDIADWSIVKRFPQLKYPDFFGSMTLIHEMCELDIDLPENYVVIVPHSPNEPRPDRTMDESDWDAVHVWLSANGYKGVILNSGNSDYQHPTIINLTGKTTILESIEILKRSQGYVGTDSCMSILASQMFNRDFYVKSSGANMERWKHVYYAPRLEFEFLKRDLLHLLSE